MLLTPLPVIRMRLIIAAIHLLMTTTCTVALQLCNGSDISLDYCELTLPSKAQKILTQQWWYSVTISTLMSQ